MTTWEHPAALAGPAISWDRAERILVVRPDNLGDVVLLGPALRALRAAAPRARLDLLAAPAGAAAAALLPEVDDVLVASVCWQQLDPYALPVAADQALIQRLAEPGYQIAVMFTSFSQSPWPAATLCRLAGVPVRVGMSKEFGGAALTHWVPSPADELHQVDRSLHLVERVGVHPAGRRLHVQLADDARAAAHHLRQQRGLPAGDFALVLPGASCSSRRYDPQRLASTVGLLGAAGLPVLVAGTAREASLVEQVAAGSPAAVALAGELDVPGLAATIASSVVVICNNSGGAHLAEAVGTPSVVLFAGTELPAQYAPRFAPSVVLTVPTGCTPCRRLTCPLPPPGTMACLDVAPDEVAARALELISSARGRRVGGGPPHRHLTDGRRGGRSAAAGPWPGSGR
ncbi:MAG TPA: glycosyltransferase family 9 protein [Kineosporiaceae bacterium]